MPDIRLLVTDFDGTLMGKTNEFPIFKEFRDLLQQLRDEHGLAWLPCTGRSLRSFSKSFGPMALMDIEPEYLVVHHGFAYRCERGRYYPNLSWNLHMLYMLWRERMRMRGCIERWHRMLFQCSSRMQTVVREPDRLWVRFDKKDVADMAAEMMQPYVEQQKYFQMFRYLVELDVRAVPFTKGIAVQELSQHLGIPARNVLTIGDGYNDISMLDLSVAGMVGCPANAEPEVKEAVHAAGGHLASEPSLAGVLETIRAFKEGNVNSVLPRDWKSPSKGHNPSSARRAKRGASRGKRRVLLVRHMLLIALAIYAVLVVFASFNMIPFVSGYIMKPFNMLMALLLKAV